jgi:hypothetical protein
MAGGPDPAQSGSPGREEVARVDTVGDDRRDESHEDRVRVIESYYEVSDAFSIDFAGLGKNYNSIIAGHAVEVSLPHLGLADGEDATPILTTPTWAYIPAEKGLS